MRITYSQYFLVCWEIKLSDIFFFLEMTIICNIYNLRTKANISVIANTSTEYCI